MDQKVKIDIATTADTTGAAQAAASLQKVDQATAGATKAAQAGTKAAQDQGKAAGDAGRDLNALGESAEKGAAAGRNLAAAIDGNVFALANLGPQLKAIGAVIRANPLGAIFVGLSAGLALLPALIERLGGVKKEAADSAAAFADSKAELDKLAQANLEKLKQQLVEIGERANIALNFFEQISAAQDKLANAKMAVELAQIGADDTLTPQQKKQREVEVRQRYADEASARERQVIEERVAARADEARQKQVVADQAEARRAEIAGRVDATVQRRTGLNLAVKGLNEQTTQALGALDPLDTEGKASVMARYNERYAPLAAAQGAAFGPEAEGRLKLMQDQLRAAEQEAAAAREAAQRAEAELAAAQRTADIDQSARGPALSLLSRAERITARIPEPVSTRGQTVGAVEEPKRFTVGGVDRTDLLDTAPTKAPRAPDFSPTVQELREINRLAAENGELTVAGLQKLAAELAELKATQSRNNQFLRAQDRR